MRLILTRHGETVENLQGITQGHMPGTLSQKGIEQAKKLALRLKDERIDAIYSSDLARAADTAKEIARFHDTSIQYVKNLREMDAGIWNGKKTNGVDWNIPQPGAETRDEVCLRARRFLDYVLSKHPNDTVLFVGHDGINRALITVILNKEPDHMNKLEHSPNTGVNIFELKKDRKHKMILMNCSKHLC
jgi:broad specificity phosphatase PhoE